MNRVSILYLFINFLLILFIGQIQINHVFADNFFENNNKYRGFYWFERHKQKNISNADNNENKKEEYQIPTADKAKEMIKILREKLDDRRAQMIATAIDLKAPMEKKREAIILYKRAEDEMWNGATDIFDASEMANFTNPELVDAANNPTNVHGVKLKRKLDEKAEDKKIRKFATKYDLVLFGDMKCPYSIEFMPVIKDFVKEYGFSLEITTFDGKGGEVAMKLGVKTTPTLIAIKKDATNAFEVSRSLVTLSHLRKSILIGIKYDLELERKSKNKKQLNKDI